MTKVKELINKMSDSEKESLINQMQVASAQERLKAYILENFSDNFNLTEYYDFVIELWNELIAWKESLDNYLSLQESAELYKLDDSTLRKAIANKKFDESEYRKTGRNYIIKKSAMKRVYGKK